MWLHFISLHGQREGEGRALAHFRLHPQPSAVQLDQLLRKRETEAGSLALLGAELGLLELLEDPLLVLASDSRAGVF